MTAISLFSLGLWMVELDYSDAWYKRAPDLHKSIGILLLIAVVQRILWRVINPPPGPIGKGIELRPAHWVHRILIILPIFVMTRGYLISTADGSSVGVFSLFTVPVTVSGIEGQEDIAGDVHLFPAIILISVVSLHALAALKHQFVDKDGTPGRMLGFGPKG